MAENIKLVAEGKYSKIAEYLYDNSLIPHFDEWVKEQKDKIKTEAEGKGYSSEKLQYIIYISINDGGGIRAEMEGFEREDYINSFKSYNIFLNEGFYNDGFISKYGWYKQHQSTILQLIQQVEIKELKEKNEELKEKIKEYENEENE